MGTMKSILAQNGRESARKCLIELVGRVGLEPTTKRLRDSFRPNRNALARRKSAIFRTFRHATVRPVRLRSAGSGSSVVAPVDHPRDRSSDRAIQARRRTGHAVRPYRSTIVSRGEPAPTGTRTPGTMSALRRRSARPSPERPQHNSLIFLRSFSTDFAGGVRPLLPDPRVRCLPDTRCNAAQRIAPDCNTSTSDAPCLAPS